MKNLSITEKRPAVSQQTVFTGASESSSLMSHWYLWSPGGRARELWFPVPCWTVSDSGARPQSFTCVVASVRNAPPQVHIIERLIPVSGTVW